MANEVTVGGSLKYSASEVEVSRSFSNIIKSIAGTKRFTHTVQSVGTSEEAIDLGDVSTPGWAVFRNLDQTNYIELKVATGGAIFAKLVPDSDGDGKGGIAVLQLGSGATAPFAIANTAACNMEIFIIEA